MPVAGTNILVHETGLAYATVAEDDDFEQDLLLRGHDG